MFHMLEKQTETTQLMSWDGFTFAGGQETS